MEKLIAILRLFAHVPGIVIAYTLHEYVKGMASAALGDPTPKNKGRLTLNPLNHLEPIGFICLFFFHVGWGKPVETHAFRYKNRKNGTIAVYTAPLLVNLFVSGAFAAAAFAMKGVQGPWIGLLFSVLSSGAVVNLYYALFNLLPVYPLDGARILAAVNPKTINWLQANEKICQIILLLLLFFGIIGQLFNVIAGALFGFLL